MSKAGIPLAATMIIAVHTSSGSRSPSALGGRDNSTMQILLLFSLVVTLLAGTSAQTAKPAAQTAKPPTQPAPPPQPAKPPAQPAKPAVQTAQPPAQLPRAAAQSTGRSGVAITVTDESGATIPGVSVELIGPTPRTGVTDDGGQANFPGLQAGTYRLRFTGDSV